tara:strand:- start:391 stop:1401 length:1011 start_codon:yes stop_codon:yes gene_type:complete
MSAPRAIAGGIYYLSGVLVKAETKEVAKKLIAKGFRTATEGIKNSGLKVQTVTNSNFVTFVTRALKKAMEQNKKIRQGPKINPKTGRPEGRGQGNNKLGGSGQSEMGRRLGSRRMKNFGDVRGGKPRAESMAKSKPKPQSSVKPVSARPGNYRTGKQDKVNPAVAGLVGAGAIGTVVYEAFSGNKSPTVTEIKAEAKKQNLTLSPKVIEYIKERRRKIAEANKKTTASNRALYADRSRKSTLENKRGFEPKTKKETEKKPIRPKLRPRVVEAKPMSLKEYLNAEIKSRKSTATKEIAKAKKGNYTSIASAKKAKSLYYMKDGKPMAAVYKRDLKGL